ncbi:centromere protein T-like [Puntigrus tetrazona]|uniref:centromere protein T-like n=1 Tax=Puntigrus tetrazona TaxID=1606681 RepID=UPI001C89EF9C|nr:centromere protein T-like [Puntigrus tetrazona]
MCFCSDLLDFVDEGRESLQDVPDEAREPLGSPGFLGSHPAAELSTPEQRSQEEDLAEDDLPELAGDDDDAQEELNQSEEEKELMHSVPADHSPESPQEEEEEEDDEADDGDDGDDALSAELSMKTPAFVRQKRVFASPSTQTTPTVLKEVNAGPAPQVAKRAPRQKRQTGVDVLPKSYVMSVFKHFAKTKVASDVYPAINEILKKYFERLADDLEAYATHAKRKTIEVEDFELLMRRQGFVTDNTPVNVLIEKYLPMEYRKLLIPVYTSETKSSRNKEGEHADHPP